MRGTYSGVFLQEMAAPANFVCLGLDFLPDALRFDNPWHVLTVGAG